MRWLIDAKIRWFSASSDHGLVLCRCMMEAKEFRDDCAFVAIASGRQKFKESYLKTIISFQKIRDSRYIHSNFSKRPYLFGNPHHHFRSARNSVLALHFMENSAFDEMDAKPGSDTNPKRSTTPLGL